MDDASKTNFCLIAHHTLCQLKKTSLTRNSFKTPSLTPRRLCERRVDTQIGFIRIAGWAYREAGYGNPYSILAIKALLAFELTTPPTPNAGTILDILATALTAQFLRTIR